MKFTGEQALELAERFGLPIQKEPDAHEGYRNDVPLEDAQRILKNGDPETIFVEADSEMAAVLKEESGERNEAGR